ncbi:hypothetical protein diail_8306 [Diaporthe ilicicola]|nr:hypothetical protein diail_8306 [Diaporthe ilicicola]
MKSANAKEVIPTAVYIIIVVVATLMLLLICCGAHKSLMTAREERLHRRRHPEHTHKTKSAWLKLLKLVWTGLRALFMLFLAIFTKRFWKDMWSDVRQTCSPSSSCGTYFNAYSCGLICNQDMEDAALPVTENRNGVVAQSFMTMPKMSEPQRPLPAVVAGAIV